MPLKREKTILEQDIPAQPSLWPVIIAFFVAAIFWIGNWHYGITMGESDRGTFGDMFGAVNSIFSGLAFVGVIYAIFLQRHEIAIARRDIKYTKEIFKAQNKQLQQQNEDAKKQEFESTFFQLLRMFADITNQIDLEKSTTSGISQTTGKDVFSVFLRRLIQELNQRASSPIENIEFEKSYKAFYQRHNSELGHYFRTMYNIIKFIDAADIQNKKFYSNIVRAQLSDAEAAILFYNGISDYGSEKFKPLIEKYGLLKNLNDTDALDKELKNNYNSSAFH